MTSTPTAKADGTVLTGVSESMRPEGWCASIACRQLFKMFKMTCCN